MTMAKKTLGVLKPKKKINEMSDAELEEFAAALGDAMAESARDQLAKRKAKS